VFRLTFRRSSSSMKRLMFLFFSSQVATLYPLCHSLLTMSSCSGSSPPGTVFCRLKVTNITSGLFITKSHRKRSSAVHALSHTETHTQWHSTSDWLGTEKPTNRRQEEESSSDYYHRDQIKHCTVVINMKRVSFLQSTGFILWKDQVYCMEGGLNANNEKYISF